MALSDMYRLSYVGRVHGQTTVNTFYYVWFAGGSGVGEAAAVTGLINQFLIDVDPVLRERLSFQWTLTGINIQDVSVGPGVFWQFPQAGAATGTQAGLAFPTSIAVVVRRRSLLPGRQGFGRIYMPAVPLAFISDSTLIPARAAEYVTLLGMLNQDLVNGGITWSPRHASKHPINPALRVPNSIRVWTLDTTVRNQRRRQPGVGV